MALVLGLGSPLMAEKLYEPPFEVLKTHKKVQLRCYEGFTVAETSFKSEYRPGSRNGFRKLAGFLFGNNDKNEKMKMTTPVSMRPAPHSPQDSWSMFFVMPPDYQKLGSPKPERPDIRIYEVKPFCALSVRFSGWADDEDLEKHTAALLKVAKENRYELTGEESQLLVFNQPLVPGPFRRNEVILKVKRPKI